MTHLPPVAWRTSSRSSSGGSQCVEAGPVLDGSGLYAVRDSKHRSGPAILYTRAEWDAFITAAKAGDFDLPG